MSLFGSPEDEVIICTDFDETMVEEKTYEKLLYRVSSRPSQYMVVLRAFRARLDKDNTETNKGLTYMRVLKQTPRSILIPIMRKIAYSLKFKRKWKAAIRFVMRKNPTTTRVVLRVLTRNFSLLPKIFLSTPYARAEFQQLVGRGVKIKFEVIGLEPGLEKASGSYGTEKRLINGTFFNNSRDKIPFIPPKSYYIGDKEEEDELRSLVKSKNAQFLCV